MRLLTLVMIISAFTTTAFAESSNCRISNYDHGETWSAMERVIPEKKLQKKGLELISSADISVGDYIEILENFNRSYPLIDFGIVKYNYDQVILKVVGLENGKAVLESVSVSNGSFFGSSDNNSNASIESIQLKLSQSRFESLPSCEKLNNL